MITNKSNSNQIKIIKLSLKIIINQKVIKTLDLLGLQSQFAERLYRNHNFIKFQIPNKIDFEVI